MVALLLPPVAFPGFPAGDLHSHVYNAWLVRLARGGELAGIQVVPLWTNTLVDLWLEILLGFISPRWAEAVVLVVLAQSLVWSSFLFCRALSRRPCWDWLPVLAALCIGWSYHMGFSNWLAATALSLLAGSIAISGERFALRAVLAFPILVLAGTGSPLPPAWMVAGIALVLAMRRWPGRAGVLLGGSATLLALAGIVLHATERGEFTVSQWSAFSGADQLLVFDTKFLIWMTGLMALWAEAIRRWIRASRAPVLTNPAFGLALLSSATALLLPDSIRFPGFAVPASYLAQRASLVSGIAWTAVAAMAPPVRWRTYAVMLLSTTWLLVLCLDWSALSRIHEATEEAVRQLPPAARVVSTLAAPPSRVLPFTHPLDRACAGKCYSWGNYEPASEQFRVRARPGNQIVVASRSESVAIEQGVYRVSGLPFPLWKLSVCQGVGAPPGICVALAKEGEVLAPTCLDPFFHPWRREPGRCTSGE